MSDTVLAIVIVPPDSATLMPVPAENVSCPFNAMPVVDEPSPTVITADCRLVKFASASPNVRALPLEVLVTMVGNAIVEFSLIMLSR